ncbi:hypothetical protein [Olsenella phocaeensis]|uniref:hypothetical protein n=1 Tax=Olsenella phocaeensis TaxID=1852385 RepID=UPI003A958D71
MPGSDGAPRCPLCGGAMRLVQTDSAGGRETWHCNRCLHEETRRALWHLTVWRRQPGGTGHERYRDADFRTRAALCAWMQRHVRAAQVTWFERERRCSAVVGPGGVTP